MGRLIHRADREHRMEQETSSWSMVNTQGGDRQSPLRAVAMDASAHR
jgi:hypothetical protein